MSEKLTAKQAAEQLLYKPEYAADKSADVKEKAAAFAEGYKAFLNAAKTEREAAAYDEAAVQANMQANMQANVSGVIVFTTPDGVDVIMSYDPLETFDWVLLTILPADIISHDTDAYIQHTFRLSTAVIVLFSLILAVMCGIYYSHRRQLEHIAFVDPVTGGICLLYTSDAADE